MNNKIILLKTMFKSTSRTNILKYSKDKKKKNYVVYELIGYSLIGVIIAAFAFGFSWIIGGSEFSAYIPMFAATLLVLISLVFTLLKAGGYLFNFKEYDMLVAMPFTIRDIVTCKFIYMYVKTIGLDILTSFAVLLGYLCHVKLSVTGIILWIVLTFFLPIIPMIISSALGTIAARIGAHFKHKQIIQAAIGIIFMIPCMFSNLIIQTVFRNEENMEIIAEKVSGAVGSIGGFLPGVKSFDEAVRNGSILHALSFIVLSLVVFELFFLVMSFFYRKLNSMLSAKAKRGKYVMKKMKQRSFVMAVCQKEFKRLTGSSIYMINALFGIIIALVAAIAAIVFGIIMDLPALLNAIGPLGDIIPIMVPFILYFFVGMVPITLIAPSIEGKNVWIPMSLPVSRMDDTKGKILAALIAEMPVSVISNIVIQVVLKQSFLVILVTTLLIVVFVLFSVLFGCFIGLKFRRLDWENEIEVVKQGGGLGVYVLVDMLLAMGLFGLCFFLSTKIVPMLASLAITLFIGLLTWLSWMGIAKNGKNW